MFLYDVADWWWQSYSSKFIFIDFNNRFIKTYFDKIYPKKSFFFIYFNLYIWVTLGKQSGYECPEERDYWPYWHPSPWKDVAILSNNVSDCSKLVNESFNVKPKNLCIEMDKAGQQKYWSRWNNQEECIKNNGNWTSLHNYLEKAPRMKILGYLFYFIYLTKFLLNIKVVIYYNICSWLVYGVWFMTKLKDR